MINVSKATIDDTHEIVELLNSAYRGEESKKGWTTEADLLVGDIRTDADSIHRIFDDAESVILKCTDPDQKVIGCVHLRKDGTRLYLGMLSVAPTLQGNGIGKRLMQNAEEYASLNGCRSIYMRVITARTELNAWYLRKGFVPNGERFPFAEDERFGMQTQPLEFMVLEKTLSPGCE